MAKFSFSAVGSLFSDSHLGSNLLPLLGEG
jgi:hypothetical protein